jgi:PhoPQ-activated pathogenicity-related protein
VIGDAPLPTMTWRSQGSDSIIVRATAKPSTARLWEATNVKARDFRVETIGKGFNYHDLSDQGNNTYVGRVAVPNRGWRAFFVELTYPTPSGKEFKTTTDVRVVPDVLPFPPPPLVRIQSKR